MKLEYKLTIDHDTLKEAFESYEDFQHFVDKMASTIRDIVEFDLIRGSIEEGIDTSNVYESQMEECINNDDEYSYDSCSDCFYRNTYFEEDLWDD